MPLPNKPRVVAFLSDYPQGAPAWKIAAALESTSDSVLQTMFLMESRGEAVMTVDASKRANKVWALQVTNVTPPIYRAMETLRAFQSAARSKMQRTMEAV